MEHNLELTKNTKFSKNDYIKSNYYLHNPVLNVTKINFITDDKDWVKRLFSANLIIKIAGYNDSNKEIVSFQDIISFGTYITPNHINAVLSINKYFKLPSNLSMPFENKSVFWKVFIELNNLSLNENEALIIELFDSKYVINRVNDWEKRVNNMLSDIKKWISNYEKYELIHSRKYKMHESLMKTFNVPMHEIITADIKKEKKTILVVKPFGLWIMGTNGRIDLLSEKGNYIIVDNAEQFRPPQWTLFLINDRKKGIKFNKDNFFKLIEK